jgi:phosphatidylglycerol:prolipoprotein diacylglycerol transferase
MYPVLLRIGNLEVTSFGFFLCAAFLATTLIMQMELQRKRVSTQGLWSATGAALIAGLVGARVYFMLLHGETAAGVVSALTARGGRVWYGGFAAATLVMIVYVKLANIAAPVMADAIAPALALGYAIGRLGCFFVGDDYGLPSALPWAVKFPQGSPPTTARMLRTVFGVEIPPAVPGDTLLAVHPTQLYEALCMTLVFGFLWTLRRRPLQPGRLFSIYLILAGLERFFVEILRAKDDRLLGGFTVAQVISLAVIIIGVIITVRIHHDGVGQQPVMKV